VGLEANQHMGYYVVKLRDSNARAKGNSPTIARLSDSDIGPASETYSLWMNRGSVLVESEVSLTAGTFVVIVCTKRRNIEGPFQLSLSTDFEETVILREVSGTSTSAGATPASSNNAVGSGSGSEGLSSSRSNSSSSNSKPVATTSGASGANSSSFMASSSSGVSATPPAGQSSSLTPNHSAAVAEDDGDDFDDCFGSEGDATPFSLLKSSTTATASPPQVRSAVPSSGGSAASKPIEEEDDDFGDGFDWPSASNKRSSGNPFSAFATAASGVARRHDSLGDDEHSFDTDNSDTSSLSEMSSGSSRLATSAPKTSGLSKAIITSSAKSAEDESSNTPPAIASSTHEEDDCDWDQSDSEDAPTATPISTSISSSTEALSSAPPRSAPIPVAAPTADRRVKFVGTGASTSAAMVPSSPSEQHASSDDDLGQDLEGGVSWISPRAQLPRRKKSPPLPATVSPRLARNVQPPGAGAASLVSSSSSNATSVIGSLSAKDDSAQQHPLLFASRYNHSSNMRHLLGRGTDVNTRDKTQRTSLMYAALYGNVASMELLLSHKADVTAVDQEQMPALLYACVGGSSKAVTLLLEHKANWAARDIRGSSSLLIACKAGHADVARLLVGCAAKASAAAGSDSSSGSSSSSGGKSSRSKARAAAKAAAAAAKAAGSVASGPGSPVYQLVNSVNSAGESPLTAAAAFGRASLVQLLLDSNADPNLHDNFQDGIFRAVASGHAEVAMMLYHERQKNANTPASASVVVASTRVATKRLTRQGSRMMAMSARDRVDTLILGQPVVLPTKNSSWDWCNVYMMRNVPKRPQPPSQFVCSFDTCRVLEILTHWDTTDAGVKSHCMLQVISMGESTFMNLILEDIDPTTRTQRIQRLLAESGSTPSSASSSPATSTTSSTLASSSSVVPTLAMPSSTSSFASPPPVPALGINGKLTSSSTVPSANTAGSEQLTESEEVIEAEYFDTLYKCLLCMVDRLIAEGILEDMSLFASAKSARRIYAGYLDSQEFLRLFMDTSDSPFTDSVAGCLSTNTATTTATASSAAPASSGTGVVTCSATARPSPAPSPSPSPAVDASSTTGPCSTISGAFTTAPSATATTSSTTSTLDAAPAAAPAASPSCTSETKQFHRLSLLFTTAICELQSRLDYISRIHTTRVTFSSRKKSLDEELGGGGLEEHTIGDIMLSAQKETTEITPVWQSLTMDLVGYTTNMRANELLVRSTSLTDEGERYE